MSNIYYSLKSVKNILRGGKPSQVCIVTSKKLASKLSWAIKEIGISKQNIILVPDGESAKDLKQVENILKKFIALGLDRKSVVIAMGGGSVGDVTGFAASIYLRGIRYIQIPTTLLAQVDSAHGGKTGVNFSSYKNQIGSFYPPTAIILDKRFLQSLSNEQVVDGLGEILKAGLIKDPSILSLLQKEKVSTLPKSQYIETLVRKTVEVKRYYAGRDFKDVGPRQILNFGHTIGHALELKYKISHGRAVLLGMLQELEIAEIMKATPHTVTENLLVLLSTLGVKIEQNLKPDLKTLIHDKKIAGMYLYLPVIEKMGQAKLLKVRFKDFSKTLETRRLDSVK